MKKHVLLGLTLMLFCFIAGGFYIVSSFQSVSEKLQRVIALDQVELLRKTLGHNIEVVQSGLLLHGSPHTDNNIIIQHIEKLADSAAVCLHCHHSQETKAKLDHMQSSLTEYTQLCSQALTNRANNMRLERVRNLAYEKGTNILQEVQSLSVASAHKISNRIDNIHAEIRATNNFLIACLILGPIAILIITLFFLRRFTGSMDTLVAATDRLTEGDFSHYIETPLKDEFKTLALSFNSMVDSINAERQKSESAHALYQTLFESAGDAICILETGDDIGRIVSVNPAASRMYGYSSNELQTMNFKQLSPAKEYEKFGDMILNILRGELVNCMLTRIHKNGNLFTTDISAGPLEIDHHKYILTFARDVTEQHQAQQEMQRANQMALVGQMAAGLAHEIKNPLAGIKVSLDVLSDELDLPAEDQEIFARIVKEIDRMERLLKSLLNYARPPVPHFDLTDINLLLNHSIKNVAVTTNKSPGKQIQFEKNLNPELPLVEADPTQLQQVFLNLYLNAIDALPEGGTISTFTQMDDDQRVWIGVSDTGVGLPQKAIEKIFNPFYTTKSKGSGLGLAICKRLIEQHDGTIEAESRLSNGTSFLITLPLVQKNREHT